VRRQITLLVAATTSIVLLAFLLPAASLVARVAAARALDTAQAQLQFLTPSVGLDDREQVAANLIGTSDDVRTAVRWTDGTWLGTRTTGTSPCRPVPSRSIPTRAPSSCSPSSGRRRRARPGVRAGRDAAGGGSASCSRPSGRAPPTWRTDCARP
jgi:hypothetical protein